MEIKLDEEFTIIGRRKYDYELKYAKKKIAQQGYGKGGEVTEKDN